ncbi:helix-turn-helix transcriptional regulator [Pseudoxanthomonas sp. LjRoot168]|uniref:helix-turn-helix domain-containing protein n=1 Tax=unclassified Pseudoxanthomonas TaxID=2645906 RepID=UPI003ECF273D
MTVTELLDAAKAAQGFSTDMALAKALGISRSAVSAWRNGVKTPDTVQCAALAGYTGLPLAQVLGVVGEARAISREEKAVWRKLAASAALLALFVAPSLMQQAHAATLHNLPSSDPSTAAAATAATAVGLGIMRN